MNLESLHLFCDIIRSNSFSLGAAANQVSQSAASQAVRQLEQEMGVRLIDRANRPFTVTREGRIFFEACQEVVERLEKARAEIDAHRARLEGTVRVAVIYSVGLQDMGWYTQQFTAAHRQARIRLAYLHPDEVVEAVVTDAADLGILSFPSPNRALTIIPWRSEPMVFVCSPRHPLAAAASVSAQDIAHQKFVAFDHTLSIRRAIDRALKAQGQKVDVAMEFDNIETIKQAIITRAGVGILPQPSVNREIEEGVLAAVPLALPPLVRPIGIIHRRQKPLSPTAAALIDFLEKHPAEARGE